VVTISCRKNVGKAAPGEWEHLSALQRGRMGQNVVDLFFNLNLSGFQLFLSGFNLFLPGFHSLKYGEHLIEFFVRSHSSFLFGCIQILNTRVLQYEYS
jgi:hypothetical protein